MTLFWFNVVKIANQRRVLNTKIENYLNIYYKYLILKLDKHLVPPVARKFIRGMHPVRWMQVATAIRPSRRN